MPVITPTDAWLKATPEVTSDTSNRSPGLLIQVYQQFSVATNPRYTPRNGSTFCNIFVWDCTAAMGAEIPHWIAPDGSPVPQYKGTETNANGMVDWLARYGAGFGWKPSGLKDALVYAQSGKPVVCVWRNVNGKPGHVAMMLPTTPGPRIAQAGGTCFFDRTLASGFGQLPVSLYVHD